MILIDFDLWVCMRERERESERETERASNQWLANKLTTCCSVFSWVFHFKLSSPFLRLVLMGR